MILLPTRGRPNSIIRFVSAYEATGGTLPVQIIIDYDDVESYGTYGIALPSFWPAPIVNEKSGDLNAAFNLGFTTYPNAEYYGIMADDIIPQSKGWDVKLRDACLPHYVSWGDDGIRQAGNLDAPAWCTHPFLGGNLVRAWGWIMSPYTNRHCQDLIWRDFVGELNLGKYLPEVHTLHAHWQAGRGEYDATYASQPSASEGHRQYWDVYKGSDRFKEDLMRVKERLGL